MVVGAGSTTAKYVRELLKRCTKFVGRMDDSRKNGRTQHAACKAEASFRTPRLARGEEQDVQRSWSKTRVSKLSTPSKTGSFVIKTVATACTAVAGPQVRPEIRHARSRFPRVARHFGPRSDSGTGDGQRNSKTNRDAAQSRHCDLSLKRVGSPRTILRSDQVDTGNSGLSLLTPLS